MIAHVAEAGEGRGRIVLRIESRPASPLAVEAAILMARAYGAEIEAIAVADANLARLIGYEGVPVYRTGGRHGLLRDGCDIVRDLAYALRGAERTVSQPSRACRCGAAR